MTTNVFVIANVKQLRTGGSFGILLPFFPNILRCWRPKFSNFYSFHNRVEFGMILGGLRNFGEGVEPPPTPLGTPLLEPSPGVRSPKSLVKSSVQGGCGDGRRR